MNRYFPAFLLLLSPIFLTGCGSKTSEKPDAPAALPVVQTALVSNGPVTETLAVTGTLTLPRDASATVAPAVSGTLSALSVRLGASVKRGEIVAQLSSKTLIGAETAAAAAQNQSAAQIAQARLNVTAAEAAARTGIAAATSALGQAKAALAGALATEAGTDAATTNARQNLTRTKQLFTDGLVPKKDVEAAQLAVTTAESTAAAQKKAVEAQRETARGQVAALDAAQTANLQTAAKKRDVQIAQASAETARGTRQTLDTQRGQFVLRAPISGQVTNIGASVGEPVDSTTKLVTLANSDVLLLQLSIPAERAASVQVGQIVTFSIASQPGKTFSARLFLVSPSVDAANATITAYARIPDSRHQFPVGGFVSARVTLARRLALLVPSDAVLRGAEGGVNVVVVDGENVTHEKEVKTGLTSDGKTEIKTGLKDGERVATSGGYGLPDGTKVSVKP